MLTPYQFSVEWVKKRFVSFTVEDMKQAYLMAGGRSSGDGSEWGNVLQALQKSERIYKHPINPFATTIRPNGKTKYINVWISRELRLKQQQNAKGDKESLTINFENNN